jgi:IclR family acetate operon transcriptional repressor
LDNPADKAVEAPSQVDEAASARNRADTGTLGKAIAVLDIVASADQPMRFTDILAVSDQPRGTLHRQLSNLVEEGLLSLGRDHSYSVGIRLLKFAARAWAGNQFRAIAEPHLRNLHDLTGETVHLGVLRGNEVIYLDKVESRQAVRNVLADWQRLAGLLHRCRQGRFVGLADDPELKAVIASIRFHRFTDSTLTTPEALLREIEEIRASGNAYDREEHEPGIRCVAAPIYSEDRSFVGGLSVTGPAYRISAELLESWAVLVRNAAGAIMEDMGARLGPRT